MENKVKVVLTCGQSHSGYQQAHEVLVSAGLVQARLRQRTDCLSMEELREMPQSLLSGRFDLRPEALYAETLLASEPAEIESSATKQLSASGVLQEIAGDLFATNANSKDWGWSDASAVWLIEFWKNFDSQMRFILVYSAPELAVGQMLHKKDSTPGNIDLEIAAWVATNSQLLRFYNRNSDRCILVNASAVIHAPTRFIDMAVSNLGLDIQRPDFNNQIDQTVIPAIASSLARALIEDCAEAKALYLELESTADLDGTAASISETEKRQASQEYVDLLSHLEQAAQEAQKHGEHVNRMHQERDELQRCLIQTKREADEQSSRLEKALSQAREQVVAQETKIALLEKQLEARSQEIVRLGKSELALAEVKQRNEEQEARMSEVQRTRDALQSEVVQLRTASIKVREENKLLLLQVQQVQEELEYYLLQHQQIPGKTQIINPFECQPAEITFDLRREFNGDNWYHAENDGRWAGPGRVSSIKLPALPLGRYEMQLNIVDAMEPEILTGMEVLLNGTKIEMGIDWQGYPALVQAQFDSQDIEDRPTWDFRFEFPKTVSPAEHGSDDQRCLAVRIQTLKLTAVR